MSVINKNAPFMELPLGISRQKGAPIERFEVFYDLEELKTYAKSNPLAYVGQTVKHVDENQKTVTLYKIGFDGAIIVIPDNSTLPITVMSSEDATAIINKYK